MQPNAENPLLESGSTDKKPRKIRFSTRTAWEMTIRENWVAIARYCGTVAPTAKQVLGALKALNLMVANIKAANGLGDAMGALGLNLPVIEQGGPKQYLLAALALGEEELDKLCSDPVELFRYLQKANADLLANAAEEDETETADS